MDRGGSLLGYLAVPDPPPSEEARPPSGHADGRGETRSFERDEEAADQVR